VITPRKAACRLAAFLIACVPLALAQGTYTQIDYPGATLTEVRGINSAGDITGSYLDNAGIENGFLLREGAYTDISYSNLPHTLVLGINDFDKVVGYAYDKGPAIGFSYDLQTQTFTTIKFPGARSTWPTAINNAGKIAGYFVESGQQRGFELVNSNYHLINPPGSTLTYVFGIAASGAVVGNGFAPNPFNFFFNGQYRTLPLAGLQESMVVGINGAGTALVGFYKVSDGVYTGFLYQNKTFQQIQFPFGLNTYAIGINTSGQIVGFFYDANHEHGFLWTPPSDAIKK